MVDSASVASFPPPCHLPLGKGAAHTTPVVTSCLAPFLPTERTKLGAVKVSGPERNLSIEGREKSGILKKKKQRKVQIQETESRTVVTRDWGKVVVQGYQHLDLRRIRSGNPRYNMVTAVNHSSLCT